MPSEALTQIKTVLANISDLKPKIPVGKISEETRFREDLGFDSLAMASLFYELQDMYPDLDEAQVNQWKKVSDCMKSIMSVR